MPLTLSRRRSYRRLDTPLARRLKAAVTASHYRTVKAFEAAAGLPRLALQALIAGQRQTPERRRLVMAAVERFLGIHFAEVAALGGFAPDGTDRAPPGPLDGLTAGQIAAAERLRTLADGRFWPGLHPDPFTFRRWPADLRTAWRALRRADRDFLARGIRSPQPSFTAWRIIVEGDQPTWLTAQPGDELAQLERLAFVAGLDALAEAEAPALVAA